MNWTDVDFAQFLRGKAINIPHTRKSVDNDRVKLKRRFAILQESAKPTHLTRCPTALNQSFGDGFVPAPQLGIKIAEIYVLTKHPRIWRPGVVCRAVFYILATPRAKANLAAAAILK